MDEQTSRLFHDLDLKVTGPGGTVLPWVLDPDLTQERPFVRAAAATRGVDCINNLEQVVIENPVAGASYTVEVTAKSPVNGSGQWCSVILSNNTVPAENLQITQFIEFGSGFYLLRWNSIPGAVYRLQTSTNLFTWNDIAGQFSSREDATQTLVSAPGLPRAFWRVVRDY